jgi:uncharacterized protein YfdQ (DUF2303 family)
LLAYKDRKSRICEARLLIFTKKQEEIPVIWYNIS